MPTTSKDNLMKMFDRPRELVGMPKGDVDHTTIFLIPENYLSQEYNFITPDMHSRFGDDSSEVVPIKKVQLPELGDIPKVVPRDDNFSVFIPSHRKVAAYLTDIFLGCPNVDDLLSVAIYVRDRVNAYLFNYCFSIALLHRQDTRDLIIPSTIRSFPDKFIDSKIFAKAREMATIIPEESRMPIEIPKNFTASDLETEHRLFYFREDLGVNLHYWHFNIIYPTDADPRIVKKDRRGEIFYYSHQQILARYNFERLSNKLHRVKRFRNLDEDIEEGYFSKLDSLVASRSWPPRLAHQRIRDLRRETEGIVMDVKQLTIWRDRIYEAINSGEVVTATGEKKQLTEFEGIDVLGNMIQSNLLSVNRKYYGDLNNMGHAFISFIHDPEGKHLESFSIMGDTAIAMRDPVFYKWYAYIINMFEDYKSILPRYTVQQLNYPGVVIENCSIECGGQKNVVDTFWQQSDIDLSRGMDFQPRGAVYIRFTHLNHSEFNYKIMINNQSGGNREGTVRIFLAPKYNETGGTWMLRDQKNLFIEMDTFRVTLKEGRNQIIRSSTQSSVTIPFNKTFHDLYTKSEDDVKFNFCGCGWPHHMLVPKGKVGGMDCELFVMISNYDNDKVEQDLSGVCDDAYSYCGLKDRKYPDRRSMGYPFDRQPRDGVDTLQQFLTPNMKVVDCKILFTDKTVKPSKGH